jgi:glycosyltransferase involved in cell wall biosynthesis
VARARRRDSTAVIVPTRDRPAELRRCLQAITAQRHELDLTEVLVVDDASASGDEIAAVVGAFEGARVLRLDAHKGPPGARNAGVRATDAELVCFTDDDCEVQPGWAASLAAPLRNGADVVAGATENGYEGRPLAEATQLVSNAFAHGSAGVGRPFAPSSSFGARAAVLREIPFDEEYVAVPAEDRDWFERVVVAGRRVALAPEARVLHFQLLGVGEFWRRHVRYGRGAYRYRRVHRAGRLEPPAFYIGLVADGFRAGPRTGLAVCLAQVATAAGFTSEALRRALRR